MSKHIVTFYKTCSMVVETDDPAKLSKPIDKMLKKQIAIDAMSEEEDWMILDSGVNNPISSEIEQEMKEDGRWPLNYSIIENESFKAI